jgi:hypothetical protein
MNQLKRSLATFAIVAAGALAAAAPAGAHDRDPNGFVVDGPYTVHQAGKPFTPPIGSDKGS